jgi:hypothetical protein
MRTVVILGVLVLSGVCAANADPVQIYSSFAATENPYASTGGYGLGAQRTIAAQFIASESAFLQITQIVLTRTSDAPAPGNTDFSVVLANDAGLQPGIPIESWSLNLSALPVPQGSILPAPVDLVSISSPFLTAGTAYWLMVSAPVDFAPFPAVLSWNLSNIGVQGPVLRSDGGGAFIVVSPPLSPAYRFVGGVESTPEPATLSLVGLALLGVTRARKRSITSSM